MPLNLTTLEAEKLERRIEALERTTIAGEIVMADRIFYVRATRSDNATNLATGIQVIIPEGMSFFEAHRLVVGRVTEELVRYFASECVTACGIER